MAEKKTAIRTLLSILSEIKLKTGFVGNPDSFTGRGIGSAGFLNKTEMILKGINGKDIIVRNTENPVFIPEKLKKFMPLLFWTRPPGSISKQTPESFLKISPSFFKIFLTS